jgi:AcrR family transcriptional regulator
MTDYAQAPGRERQKRATEESILDAVERCLSRTTVDDLTYLQISLEAGIADRTVYRYFPTKEELLAAFWWRVQQTLGLERATRSLADYLETRPQAFGQMDEREPVMRALIASPQARQARRRLRKERQDGIRRLVAQAAPDLPEPEFTELCGLVHLLGSAPTWQALKDGWDLDGPQAGRLAARAIETLVEAAKASVKSAPANPKEAS